MPSFKWYIVFKFLVNSSFSCFPFLFVFHFSSLLFRNSFLFPYHLPSLCVTALLVSVVVRIRLQHKILKISHTALCLNTHCNRLCLCVAHFSSHSKIMRCAARNKIKISERQWSAGHKIYTTWSDE